MIDLVLVLLGADIVREGVIHPHLPDPHGTK